jgi:hypothetical protein
MNCFFIIYQCINYITPNMSQPSNNNLCDDCGARTDITTNCHHPYKCKYVPKCHDCGARTDIVGNGHFNNCIYVPTCNDCGVRTDINGYCHKLMCKYAPIYKDNDPRDDVLDQSAYVTCYSINRKNFT